MAVTPEQTPQQPATPGQPAYPQPPYAAPQPWPVHQPPKKKGMPTWAIVLIVLAGLMVVACVGGVALIGLGAKGVSDANKAALKDVSLTSCGADGGQFDIVGPKATVSVTNHGSSKATYSVKVEFVDGSTQLGTGTAVVNDLAPGQTAEADASSFAGGKGGGSFKCHITDVSKF